ncbi:WD repeat-containing protein 89 [Maniola hyperantus]|uniref:WD repeat-containing protein 89 n=1 Tax=Aphantopus hyperantus TaxID=2795564 RepID=UPI001568B0A1|nr:WD repeat-containing protein 89 [Maniola hyperantus]
MADIIENIEIDKDTVSPEELNTLFSKKYSLLAETAVTLKKTSINKLSVSKSLNIAVSLLDNSIEVYRLEQTSLCKVCRLSGHKKPLTEVVLSPKEEHLLYSAGHDGVKLWDTRTSGLCVQEYKDEPDASPRAYECMDVSCTGRVICAGSQMALDDAYMVFWDQRNPEPLGGYWNSHTEDITQVKFHKDKSEILASGSQDGLLNIYNIAEPNEDDALTYSLNIENSVEKISWLTDNQVACVTQSNDLQLWDAYTGDRLKSYDREKIARSIKRSRADDCYVVDAYMAAGGAALIVAGSYGGKGDVLRSVAVTQRRLQPSTNFTANKQTVRCCAHDKHRDLLVTTGESGLIHVWSCDKPDEDAVAKKMTTSLRSHDKRHKPY